MSVPESLRRRPSSTHCISEATVRAAGKPEPSRGYNGMLNASCFCFRPLNGVAVWLADQGLAISPGSPANIVHRFVLLFEPVAKVVLVHQNEAAVRHGEGVAEVVVGFAHDQAL